FRSYAGFLEHESSWDAAAKQYINSLPFLRATPDDRLALALRNLGGVLNQASRPTEAEPYVRESLALYRKLHTDEDAVGTGWATGVLSYSLYLQHRWPEAEKSYRETLRIYEKCNITDTDEYADQVRSLLDVLKSENKLADGDALCREIL